MATTIRPVGHRVVLGALLLLVAIPSMADTIHQNQVINGPATWLASDNDHVIVGTVTITSTGSLTIQDGCTVRFDQGAYLVVHGTLDAAGTDAAGITFTRRTTDDLWHGLYFYASSTASLTHCLVEHARAYGSSAGIVATGAMPSLEHCEIRQNATGLWLQDASPALTNCRIVENTGYGVYATGASSPTFGGSLAQWNDIHDNGDGQPDRDYRNGTADVLAAYVYWGTLAADEIEARIHHHPDEASLGRVIYQPYTDAEHEHQYGGVPVVEPPELPAAFALAPNAPNPFNPFTLIRYELPEACDVRLEILDLAGRRLAMLVDGPQAAGYRAVRWDARGAAAGVYLCRLVAGDFRQVRKLVLVR